MSLIDAVGFTNKVHISTEGYEPGDLSYCLISAYARDLVVKLKDPYRGRTLGGSRREVYYWSAASERRFRFTLDNSVHLFPYIIRLSYPDVYPSNGPEVKGHLNSILQFLRRKGSAYFWILEFQERGAPHYHILINKWIPKGDLASRWFRIVNSGDLDHLTYGTRIEAIRDRGKIKGYLNKYMCKREQKIVPAGFEKVGRFWGHTRGLLEVKHRVAYVGMYRHVRAQIRPLRKVRERGLLSSHISYRAKIGAKKRNGQRSFIIKNGSSLRI